jgi:hypothetical protein
MDQSLVLRALSAYLATDGLVVERPTSQASVEVIGDLKYVVLRNESRRILAVY